MTATKNDNLSLKNALPVLLALLVVAAVRLYGLGQAALPDYDSVRNWQIVQEIAHGNLRNLFHHGSPGFSVLYVPVAWVTTNFHVFQHLNALLAVAAVGALAWFVADIARLKPWETALLTLFIGTSVFLTFSGRDFTMGSASLLVFAGLLRAYYRRLETPTDQHLRRAALWLALGLSINYKFILTLPILAVFELLQRDGLLGQRRNWLRVVGILAAPFVVFGLLGVLAGLPWYRWPAVYYNVLFPGAANAAGRQGSVQLDLAYYPWFLLQYESSGVVLMWLIALPLVWKQELFHELRRINLVRYLAVWAYAYLAGMSLLLKAPRGLLLAYGLFYTLTFLSVRRDVKGWLLAALLLVACAFNLNKIEREVYAYTPSSYPQVAQWLRQHHTTKVVSTVGLGLAPFGVDSVVAITSEKQLAQFRQRGYQYVLLDDYYVVTNVQQFDSLRRQQPVAEWPEPMLGAPLLFLEHSEYTGLSMKETIKLQHRVKRSGGAHLRLYRLR
ncbi:hypothetical protein [Hymenobacter chitinivorans]|uniref:Dolichyl-phosphate-mannose-protein mannosyltransferase n=1 Tax=Hymenobacter chitinivorans DSM 11115 TaxID=1121954 RepID=A0A2M9AQG7_9BACT|nr:hypothetical protein [Hymenobacter chitinivorans]PJJ47944.1 hypothetical protein CLV45_4635 [Hymenobacter chitinivorans DSM 11115]